MLLLVVQADLQDAQHLRQRRRVGARQQALDRLVDMRPEGGDLRTVRPGQEAAQRARMPGTGGHIVGIEQVAEAGVEDRVARQMRQQQELLEEPGGMRPMPLGGAGIGHRLHDLVLGAERRRASFGLGAHRAKRRAPSAARIMRSGRGPDGVKGCALTLAVEANDR